MQIFHNKPITTANFTPFAYKQSSKVKFHSMHCVRVSISYFASETHSFCRKKRNTFFSDDLDLYCEHYCNTQTWWICFCLFSPPEGRHRDATGKLHRCLFHPGWRRGSRNSGWADRVYLQMLHSLGCRKEWNAREHLNGVSPHAGEGICRASSRKRVMKRKIILLLRDINIAFIVSIYTTVRGVFVNNATTTVLGTSTSTYI